MHKKTLEDSGKLITDNKNDSEKPIGVMRALIPINRNLSEKLFGQLGNLLDRNI